LFPKQIPEEADEILKKMLEGLIECKKQTDGLQKEIEEISKKSSSLNFFEFGDRLSKRLMEVAQLGSDIDKDVMLLVGHTAGGTRVRRPTDARGHAFYRAEFRQGAENLTGKAMDEVTSVINESIGMSKTDEIIKTLKEKLIKNKQELEKKDVRIKELEQLQLSQQENQQKAQEALFGKALEAVVEVAGKSRDNSRAPSPTPPPYEPLKQ
jgi:hypothetical protein